MRDRAGGDALPRPGTTVGLAMTMADDDDDFLFQDEEEDEADEVSELVPGMPPWQVLIVDDDPEVHAMTRLVMRKFAFQGRGLAFISAYSAAEALEVMKGEHDIAMILLDVVMESDDAGLKLVPRIRDELGNRAVRIILRTGQPGQAPEDAVIAGYDVNDYKAKTELTARKLVTATITALRAYHHIRTLERSCLGMERVAGLGLCQMALSGPSSAAGAALDQMAEVLEQPADGLFCVIYGADRLSARILAGRGRYQDAAGHPLATVADTGALATALRSPGDLRHEFTDDAMTLAWPLTPQASSGGGAHAGAVAMLHLHLARPLDEIARRLALLMMMRIADALVTAWALEQARDPA
ncbi:response regulator receiver domain-containing protein [Nitrospirillum bahiense]|uniref:Response regulator receiver domain-containing protein n=2 Tax=Nitrospirillum amazonense TaxID=28077 RepID=A0A560FW81_9PROT|nr:response regulator receiver domain-containing protein [Nitrospirillum amazonense]